MKTKKEKQRRKLPYFCSSKNTPPQFLFLILTVLISTLSFAQIDINNGAAFGCGSTITLASNSQNISSSTFTWDATGPILFRKKGTTGNGSRSLTINGDNEVEITVKGTGKIFLKVTDTSQTPAVVNRFDVEINPTSNQLDPKFSVLYGKINAPDNIKTRSHWIPLNVQPGNPTNQEVIITDASPLNVAWFAQGGIVIVSQSNFNNPDGTYGAKVVIESDGTNNKGFLSASFADACTGVCGGEPSTTWEILKNFKPTEIFGVTCLRDNNLDSSKSTAYTVSDDIAGNGIFRWEVELLDPNTPASAIKIVSSELYGNAAAILYQDGFSPSNVGNFKIKIINTVFEDFPLIKPIFNPVAQTLERIITASPATPSVDEQVYCADATVGASLTVKVKNAEVNKIYQWSVVGDNDWTITPIASDGSIATITFNDTDSGILNVTAYDIAEPECKSAPAIAFINRLGAEDITINGPTCIQSNSSNAFTFTASPFAKYDWTIPSAITDVNSGWSVQRSGNILTLTPPVGGIPANSTGKFTISATLDTCNSNKTADYSFEVAPVAPKISGPECTIPNTNYNYTINYNGASNAEVVVLDDRNSIIETKNLTSPEDFVFTPTNAYGSFKLEVSTYNNRACNSEAVTKEVKVAPTTAISRVNTTCDNQITFTANATGIADIFRWEFPSTWSIVGGSQGTNTITLQSDGNQGTVRVFASNNGCEGNSSSLDVDPLRSINDITFSIQELDLGGQIFNVLVAEATDTLTLQWLYLQNQDDYDQSTCSIVNPSNIVPTNPQLGKSAQAFLFPTNRWFALQVTDPTRPNCSTCFVVDVTTVTRKKSRSISPKQKIELRKSLTNDLNIKTYPNPANDYLNVEIPLKEKVGAMALMDMNGSIVFKKEQANNKEIIDASTLAKGTYILLTQTQNSYTTKKVILK